jgi:hypothetical protein
MDLLNETNDVARSVAAMAVVELFLRIDVKRTAAFVVKGAEALILPAGFAEHDVLADDFQDIDSAFDLTQ